MGFTVFLYWVYAVLVHHVSDTLFCILSQFIFDLCFYYTCINSNSVTPTLTMPTLDSHHTVDYPIHYSSSACFCTAASIWFSFFLIQGSHWCVTSHCAVWTLSCACNTSYSELHNTSMKWTSLWSELWRNLKLTCFQLDISFGLQDVFWQLSYI